MPSRYQPLADYLAGLPPEMTTVTLSPRAIERLIGVPLPGGAGSRWWWANTSTTVQGRTWTAAGWRVASIKLRPGGEAITFVRAVDSTA